MGHPACVEILLQAGAPADYRSAQGKSPISCLLELAGDPAILRHLLKAGADPNSTNPTSRQTPLHVAARRGLHVPMAILMSSGANVNAADATGNTPLMLSAKGGHVTSVRMLLLEGAAAEAINSQGETAVHHAARGGHWSCMGELLEAGVDPDVRDLRGLSPFWCAFKSGKMAVVDALLNYNCDVNVQDPETKMTALHIAADSGDLDIVEKLLEGGALTNIRDNNWETPFLVALRQKQVPVAEALISHGCDVSVTDKAFNSGLHIAAREGLTQVVPHLLQRGVDGNLKGPQGVTPLMLACQGGYQDIVSDLLIHGANPDILDRNRMSALTYTILSYAKDSVVNGITRLLIRHGCNPCEMTMLKKALSTLRMRVSDPDLVRDGQYSPLEVAFVRGRPVVFLMLLACGGNSADINLADLHHGGDYLNPSPMSASATGQLIKAIKRHRDSVPSLKHLARRPSVKALRMPVSYSTKLRDQKLRDFLNFAELESIEYGFMSGRTDCNENPVANGISPKSEERGRSSYQFAMCCRRVPTDSSRIPIVWRSPGSNTDQKEEKKPQQSTNSVESEDKHNIQTLAPPRRDNQNNIQGHGRSSTDAKRCGLPVRKTRTKKLTAGDMLGSPLPREMTSPLDHTQSWVRSRGQLSYSKKLSTPSVTNSSREGAGIAKQDLRDVMGHWKCYTSPLEMEDMISLDSSHDRQSETGSTSNASLTSGPGRGRARSADRSRIPTFQRSNSMRSSFNRGSKSETNSPALTRKASAIPRFSPAQKQSRNKELNSSGSCRFQESSIPNRRPQPESWASPGPKRRGLQSVWNRDRST